MPDETGSEQAPPQEEIPQSGVTRRGFWGKTLLALAGLGLVVKGFESASPQPDEYQKAAKKQLENQQSRLRNFKVTDNPDIIEKGGLAARKAPIRPEDPTDRGEYLLQPGELLEGKHFINPRGDLKTASNLEGNWLTFKGRDGNIYFANIQGLSGTYLEEIPNIPARPAVTPSLDPAAKP